MRAWKSSIVATSTCISSTGTCRWKFTQAWKALEQLYASKRVRAIIPKSVKPERIRESIALFDFELPKDDMRAIEGMDREQRIGADPDTASFK
jgi:diketogulonate reductase-like aldo/keto reductase